MSEIMPLAQFDLGEWLKSAWSLILVVLGFSLVVFVHELGHFLAAKWAKVRVDKFCIGFGPELFGFTRGETRYGFNVLPLGGYVKMLGQEDFAVDKSGELKVKDESGSFTNKTIGQRMVIVSAGVLMNLVFAAIGLTIYMMVGYRTPPAVVGFLAPSTPASRSGLRPGDKILSINDTTMHDFQDVLMRIVLSDPGEVLEFDVLRDGRPVHPRPRILPEFKADQQVRQVGMAAGWTTTVARASGSEADQLADDELQPSDKLVAAVTDGKTTPIRTMGDAWDELTRARGRMVAFQVARPTEAVKVEQHFNPDAPEPASKTLTARARAQWYVQPETQGAPLSASLLGMVPRLKAGVPATKEAADVAGVEPSDVIVAYGGTEYPNSEEFARLVEETPDQDVTLVVRRPRAANPSMKLSAAAVRFVVTAREAWLEAAVRSLDEARTLVHAAVTQSTLGLDDRTAIETLAAQAKTPALWLKWLEGVDQRKLTIRPKRPFKLFGGAKPHIGMSIDLPEDDRLVVSDITPKIDGRASPAAAAKLPRGAVILRVNGNAATTWADLTEALASASGTGVKIQYRVGIDYREATLAVPESLTTALKLPPDARIQSIASQDKVEIDGTDGKRHTLYLPDWQAVRELLKQNVGKTVTVKWLEAEGVSRDAEYAAKADNADPWMLRVGFVPQFICYPMLVNVRVTNPVEAMWLGIKKTYFTTWNAIQSIRHIAFTRQLGVEKVSGPVGIARLGMQAAELGWTQLLWFLCLISANLAVINALPLPIVDGGLFFFLLLEKLRGEPVSIKTQAATQLIGIVLIAGVFLFVTFQDIVNWK